MAYKHILYEENKKDYIGILTLNEPEKRNALGREAEEEITSCIQDAAKREVLKVLILRAAGDIFCAGHNRAEILERPAHEIRRLFQTSFNMMYALRTVPFCIIAEVQGIAMAGGCHLAAGCDLITAGKEKAKFGMTGLIYSYNCSTPTIAVSRAVPQKKCFEMLMTANLYTAEEAAAFNLVNKVFPDAKLHEMTYAWAKEIAKTSKYAIYTSKQVFYAQVEMTEWQAYHYAKEMMALEGISINSTEGFKAFLEKREPKWDESGIF
jgi:enoyl-CoA hydratase/carnithine racemase